MEKSQGTILITGATGFIGRRLTQRLLDDGFLYIPWREAAPVLSVAIAKRLIISLLRPTGHTFGV